MLPIRHRFILAASTALIAVALALPFTPEYRPLGERMAQRYAENLGHIVDEGRARDAQAAAAAQAHDEALAADQERQRIAAGYDSLKAEFLRILRTRRPPVVTTAENAGRALQQLAGAARQTGFYASAGIDPAQLPLSCTDPATTVDMLHREARRDRNILACAVQMALHRADYPEPGPQLMIALEYRLLNAEEAGHYPLQTLVSYVWLPQLYAAAYAGRAPDPLPELNSGEAINPALFRDGIAPSFTRRLIETATTDEKLELLTHTYPDLQRMAALGTRLAQACQAMKRTPCLTSN